MSALQVAVIALATYVGARAVIELWRWRRELRRSSRAVAQALVDHVEGRTRS